MRLPLSPPPESPPRGPFQHPGRLHLRPLSPHPFPLIFFPGAVGGGGGVFWGLVWGGLGGVFFVGG